MFVCVVILSRSLVPHASSTVYLLWCVISYDTAFMFFRFNTFQFHVPFISFHEKFKDNLSCNPVEMENDP